MGNIIRAVVVILYKLELEKVVYGMDNNQFLFILELEKNMCCMTPVIHCSIGN